MIISLLDWQLSQKCRWARIGRHVQTQINKHPCSIPYDNVRWILLGIPHFSLILPRFRPRLMKRLILLWQLYNHQESHMSVKNFLPNISGYYFLLMMGPIETTIKPIHNLISRDQTSARVNYFYIHFLLSFLGHTQPYKVQSHTVVPKNYVRLQIFLKNITDINSNNNLSSNLCCNKRV